MSETRKLTITRTCDVCGRKVTTDDSTAQPHAFDGWYHVTLQGKSEWHVYSPWCLGGLLRGLPQSALA